MVTVSKCNFTFKLALNNIL